MGNGPREMEEMVISSAFWRQRRVFVTGHTGFKGSWLSLMLQRLDARVTGYALAPPTTPSLYDLQDVSATLDDRRGDIADVEALRAAMVAAGPEIVIHMAAQPLVLRGYQDPVETYRVNVMGTVALLEAVRAAPSVRTVLVVTTDKCYENQEWAWGYRETDRLGGRDPYSNSKACAEHVVTAYARSFLAERGVRILTARAGNVIGGGDFADNRILPDAARAIRAGRKLEVRSPTAVRPWQHVLEPLFGYLQLCERAESDDNALGAFNFGPGVEGECNVARLLDGFYAGFDHAPGWERDGAQHPHEANLLRLDTSRARAVLGWTPLLTLEENIAWTAEWYRAWVAGEDVRPVTLEQIDRFMGARVRLTSPFSPDASETERDDQTQHVEIFRAAS